MQLSATSYWRSSTNMSFWNLRIVFFRIIFKHTASLEFVSRSSLGQIYGLVLITMILRGDCREAYRNSKVLEIRGRGCCLRTFCHLVWYGEYHKWIVDELPSQWAMLKLRLKSGMNSSSVLPTRNLDHEELPILLGPALFSSLQEPLCTCSRVRTRFARSMHSTQLWRVCMLEEGRRWRARLRPKNPWYFQSMSTWEFEGEKSLDEDSIKIDFLPH
jgi:hypothetical protein